MDATIRSCAPFVGVTAARSCDCPCHGLRFDRFGSGVTVKDGGYVLNPTIVELSAEDYQDGDEGCLSVPGLWYPTKRAWYARVVGSDLDGKEVSVEGTELMARCLQHEVDHLDGMLYLDRLERSVRKKAMRAMREQL